MKNLRKRFNRFCLKHRNKGIPNLMLYIIIGSAIVTGLYYLGYPQIYDVLCFKRDMILKGQIWRLFSYVFTMSSGSIFLTLIMLYCYYSLGRALEMTWGTFRFNLYYVSGIILMDIFAMAFGGIQTGGYSFSMYYTSEMMNCLHLSLLLCYATSYPDARFIVFFIIPIRAWILALIYLIVTAFSVLSMSVPVMYFPHNLFPLVGLMNYFIFCGSDIINVLPPTWRLRIRQGKRKKVAPKQTGSVPFSREGSKKAAAPYTHRCTVCGRTDASNPELEFRYCSRCNGYFCYCEDHINNHTHVE